MVQNTLVSCRSSRFQTQIRKFNVIKNSAQFFFFVKEKCRIKYFFDGALRLVSAVSLSKHLWVLKLGLFCYCFRKIFRLIGNEIKTEHWGETFTLPRKVRKYFNSRDLRPFRKRWKFWTCFWSPAAGRLKFIANSIPGRFA